MSCSFPGQPAKSVELYTEGSSILDLAENAK